MQGLTFEIALERLIDLLPLLVAATIGTALLETGVYLFFTRIVKSKYALPYTLIAPAALALVLFTLYPFVYNIRLAFSDLRLKTISCYIPNTDVTNVPCSLGQAALNANVNISLDDLPVREEPSETAPQAFTLQRGDEVRITSRSKTSNYISENAEPNCGTPLTPAAGFTSYQECREGVWAQWRLAYETQDTRNWWQIETQDGETGWIPDTTYFMTGNAELYAESMGGGDIAGSVAEGQEVRVVKREGEQWYQVRTPAGLTGWTTVKPSSVNLYIPASTVTLYRAQDTLSEQVGTAEQGAAGVRLLRDPAEITWYQIATDGGQEAWINSVAIREIYNAEADTPVYQEMQASSQIVTTLEDGDRARILSTMTETWYEVNVLGLENTYTGWVNVEPEAVEGFAMPEDRTIYADPDESSQELGRVAATTLVANRDNRNVEGDIWYLIISPGGIEGWVKAEPSDTIPMVILPAEATLYNESGGEAPVLIDPDRAPAEQAPLPMGTQVTQNNAVEVQWYQVQLSEDQRGWINQAPREISKQYVTTGETPAYAAFADTADVVTTIAQNTVVEVTATQVETWYQVQTAERVTGWTNVAPVEIRTISVVPQVVELYAATSRATEVVGTLEQGAEVETVASTAVLWYQIRALDGTVGWANVEAKQSITTEREIVLYSLRYGWNNFKRVFADIDPATGDVRGWGRLLQTENSTFPRLMRTTILWTTFNVIFHLVFGMILALMLNQEGLKLKGFYRAIIILPWAVPQVIIALIWRGEFDLQFGFVNTLLGQVGIDPINWKLSPTPAFVAVTFVNIWLGIPFYMVTLLGGLQSIGGDYYEAAAMDGANAWNRFRHITVPLIRPVAVPIVTLDVIWTFNNFNVIYLITEGGPNESTNILVTALYNAAFGRNGQFQLGFAAAFSLVIFAVLFLFAIVWVTQSGALKGIYEK